MTEVLQTGPGPGEGEDDAVNDYGSKLETRSAQVAFDQLSKQYGEGAQPQAPAPSPEGGDPSAVDVKVTPEGLEDEGGLGSSIARNVAEIPLQAVSGAVEAFQNTINIADDIANYVSDEFPSLGAGVVFDEKDGLRFVDKEEFDSARAKNKAKGGADMTTLLDAFQKDAKTPTGEFTRSAAKFVAGFVGAGKALKGISAFTKMGAVGQAAVKGLAADFAVFDGHEDRLANLVQEYPGLQNPVTEYLAADPSDSKLEGRFKNSIEGLGLGVVTEGLFRGVKALRAARVARTAAKGMVRGTGTVIEPAVRKMDLTDLGDAGSDALVLKRNSGPVVVAAKRGAGVKPADVLNDAENVFEINFARINEPEDIQKVMKQMAKQDQPGVEGARRGVRTWEQTKLSADKQNAWDTLSKRRAGAPLNAEEAVAARNLWATSADKLSTLAQQAAANPSEANLFKFRKMVSTHYAIQREVIAARTETARALNAWKIPSGTDKELARQIDTALESVGGTELTKDLADRIAKMTMAGMHEGVEKVIEGTVFAKSKDAFAQAYISGMLTNPATHVANISSNLGVVTQQIYERKVAEWIGATSGEEAVVQAGEAMAMAHGAMTGFGDALRAAGKRWKTGASSLGGLDKVDVPKGSLSAETWGVTESHLGAALDFVDSVTQVPGRMLASGDEFFKSIGYRMEVHAQAVRQSATEGLTGDALKKRMAELVEKPPEHIRLAAVDAAMYSTFTQRPAEYPKQLADWIQKFPVMGRLVLPFKNTPINIATYAFERTPLASAVKSFRADIAAGGARANIARARQATGTMIGWSAVDLALSGRLTGSGPKDPAERQAWRRQGFQPYSAKFGDTWLSYNRLDPMGMTFGMGADMAEAIATADDSVSEDVFAEALTAMSFGVAKNLVSRTYMQGISEFFDAVSDPDSKGQQFWKRSAGAFVPAGVAATARALDPEMKSASTIVDKVKSRIPHFSEGVPAYRDLWGRKVSFRSPVGVMYDLFSPVYISEEDPQPIDKEFDRLGFFPSMPARKFSIQGVEMKLDQKQYSRYTQLAGNEVKSVFGMTALETMNAIVDGSHPMASVYQMYSDGADGGKVDMLQKILGDFRDLAKKQLLEEDEELKIDFEINRKFGSGKLDPALTGE